MGCDTIMREACGERMILGCEMNLCSRITLGSKAIARAWNLSDR
ncbi:MAG: hypothetical protein AAGE92_01010 [Cyanobacteria bacterium P01_G01_bin.4]